MAGGLGLARQNVILQTKAKGRFSQGVFLGKQLHEVISAIRRFAQIRYCSSGSGIWAGGLSEGAVVLWWGHSLADRLRPHYDGVYDERSA